MHRTLNSLLLAASLVALPVVASGCAARLRVYDVEYHDYHRWGRNEGAYYKRWEVETHREHRDFGHRSDDEQKEYWKWRHAHGDNDRH